MTSYQSVRARFLTTTPPYSILYAPEYTPCNTIFPTIIGCDAYKKDDYFTLRFDSEKNNGNYDSVFYDKYESRRSIIYFLDDLPQSITNSANKINVDIKTAARAYRKICADRSFDFVAYNLMCRNVYGFIIRQYIIMLFATTTNLTCKNKNSTLTCGLVFRSKFFADRYTVHYYTFLNSFEQNEVNVGILLQSMRDSRQYYRQLNMSFKKIVVATIKDITTALCNYIPTDVIVSIYNAHLFRFEYDDNIILVSS
jgi:hypothetical protein